MLFTAQPTIFGVKFFRVFTPNVLLPEAQKKPSVWMAFNKNVSRQYGLKFEPEIAAGLAAARRAALLPRLS